MDAGSILQVELERTSASQDGWRAGLWTRAPGVPATPGNLSSSSLLRLSAFPPWLRRTSSPG